MNKINLTIDKDNPKEDFKRIANELMNKWILGSGETEYRIAEIEFYLNDKDRYNDKYVHNHPMQKTSNRWYFHGSGIDLTCGGKNYYGGILIRALQDINDDKGYYYGPLIILTEIFSRFPDVYTTGCTFGLIPDKESRLKPENPIAAPRVGLNPNKQPEMLNEYNRYLIMPRKKHAEKTRIEEAMKRQRIYKPEDIKDIWG